MIRGFPSTNCLVCLPGVESLSAAYDKNPDFVDEQGAADVSRQIIEANSMLNLLKANHFKLLRARCEIDSLPQPESPYSEYIKNRHDKQVKHVFFSFSFNYHISIIYDIIGATSDCSIHSYG